MKTRTEFQKIVIALYLVVLQLVLMNLFNFRSEYKTELEVPEKTIEFTVLEVVDRVATDYDAQGSGTSGFIVKDGSQLLYLEVDKGSRLDSSKSQFLLRTTYGGLETIQPLFLYDDFSGE